MHWLWRLCGSLQGCDQILGDGRQRYRGNAHNDGEEELVQVDPNTQRNDQRGEQRRHANLAGVMILRQRDNGIDAGIDVPYFNRKECEFFFFYLFLSPSAYSLATQADANS